MSAVSDIALRIAGVLVERCTHQKLPKFSEEVAGLNIPDSPQDLSKRDRVLAARKSKSLREHGEIGRRLGAYIGDIDLEEAGSFILEENSQPITEITRRDVAKYFEDELAGSSNLLDLLRRFFRLTTPLDEFLGGNSLDREIEQHMIRNQGDWTVEYLLERVGALWCSRDRFAGLIEAALHPLARRGAEQADLAAHISDVLRRDGYEVAVGGDESGYPLYRLKPITRGVPGAPKNLIFASDGPQPEIGFSDAINNDITILSHADSCLVYDRPILARWSSLVRTRRLVE